MTITVSLKGMDFLLLPHNLWTFQHALISNNGGRAINWFFNLSEDVLTDQINF